MMEKEIYKSKDKQVVPFLFTQEGVEFSGTEIQESLLYFKFVPKELCEKLEKEFLTRKAPPVQAKDLLDAVETFRNKVFSMKKEE